MAQRPAWSIKDDRIIKLYFDFEWNGGFALKQKQKNIVNLHSSILQATDNTALEISSKGLVPLGKSIGAFSLKYNGVALENIFQSSKKFEHGGPYIDLMDVSPREAKQDARIRNSGTIIAFCLGNDEWPTEPKTLFYDYIYVTALIQNFGKNLNLDEYEWFTDIEFNPSKSINCQARSVAIYKLIQKNSLWDCLNDKECWKEFHIKYVLG